MPKFPSHLILALLSLGDLTPSVQAHPTLSEDLVEGAEALHKRAIHILNR